LFFMIGRRAYRETERIRAREDIVIHYKAGNLRYKARTVDVSEQGIALFVARPIYLPPQTTITLVVKSERYEANLDAIIVYVKKDGEGWRYSARVQPVNETDKRQYMQIIYDRKHSLPEHLNLWETVYDEMVRNVQRRVVQPLSDKRKVPRIPLECPIVFTNGVGCTLHSFNYLFFSATGFQSDVSAGAVITFYTKSNIEVILRHTGKTTTGNQEVLLSVENIDDIVDRGLIDQMLDDLIHPHSESA